MNETQTAWVAGLIEGEGYISIERKRYTSVTGVVQSYAYPRVAVAMSDEDVIRKLHKITRCGNVRPFQPTGNRKKMYRWVVSDSREAQAILKAVLPHLGNRRAKKAREVLKVKIRKAVALSETFDYSSPVAEQSAGKEQYLESSDHQAR